MISDVRRCWCHTQNGCIATKAGLRMLCAEATKDKHKTWDFKAWDWAHTQHTHWLVEDSHYIWHLRIRTVTRLSSFHQPHQIGVIKVTNLDQFLHAKKTVKTKWTCFLPFGGVPCCQQESDGIVVGAHQFSGLLAVFGLTRWANSLWTATDILVPLKGTYPLRMRHQPEICVLWKCLLSLDSEMFKFKWYAFFFEVLDFPGTTCGSWNCNPCCAGHTTDVCLPQWDSWALNVSGKAA